MRKFWMGVAIVSTWACGEGLPEEGESAEPVAVDSTSDPLICGAEDWDDVEHFAEAGGNDVVGAHYGKAVARLSMGGGTCTGSLIGPRTVLTAAHCIRNNTATASFGRYTGGLSMGRDRLVDLGLTRGEADAVSSNAFRTFQCQLVKRYDNAAGGDRDVALFDCPPNDVAGLGAVNPGDVWGVLKTAPGRRAEGTDLHAVTYNRKLNSNSRKVLLSPFGEVTDSADGCWGPYEDCFEHSVDTRPGSSGGPIFLDSTHQVMGVVSGNRPYWWGVEQASCPWLATNYGAYLPPNWGYGIAWGNPTLPDQPGYASTAWMGGSGGTRRVLNCAEDELAIGIVGDTRDLGSAGYRIVGNLGVVCAPFMEVESQAHRPLHRAQVLAGGSDETGQGGRFDLNAYLAEVPDVVDDGQVNDFEDQQQSLTLCSPGYFMTGIRAYAGPAAVGSIIGITCTRYDGRGGQLRQPRKPIGENDDWTYRNLSCPIINGSTARAVRGLTIRGGDFTRGLSLHCQGM